MGRVWRSLAAIAAVAALLVASCGPGGDRDTPAASHVSASPDASTSSTAEVYTTSEFLGGGMEVRLDDDKWIVSADSPAHFAAAEEDDPEYRVLFSLDAYPVENGQRVKGVPVTAEGLLNWLEANDSLHVASEPDGSIGGRVPAKVADISISSEAVNDDPGCPAEVCVNPIAFPPSDEVYGLAGDDVIRLYLSDIEYGGNKHLLVVAIEGRDRRDLDAFVPPAEELIASIDAPIDPA